jgi:hypothetical protein
MAFVDLWIAVGADRLHQRLNETEDYWEAGGMFRKGVLTSIAVSWALWTALANEHPARRWLRAWLMAFGLCFEETWTHPDEWLGEPWAKLLLMTVWLLILLRPFFIIRRGDNDLPGESPRQWSVSKLFLGLTIAAMWIALLNHLYLQWWLSDYLQNEEFRTRISLWRTFHMMVWEETLSPALFSMFWLLPLSWMLLGRRFTLSHAVAAIALLVMILPAYMLWERFWRPHYQPDYGYAFPYIVAPHCGGLAGPVLLHLACWRLLGWRLARRQ